MPGPVLRPSPLLEIILQFSQEQKIIVSQTSFVVILHNYFLFLRKKLNDYFFLKALVNA